MICPKVRKRCLQWLRTLGCYHGVPHNRVDSCSSGVCPYDYKHLKCVEYTRVKRNPKSLVDKDGVRREYHE
jgi:hypothetical protein